MKKTVKYIFLAIFILSVALSLGGCDFDISSILGEYVCVHEWSEWDIVEQGDCKTPGIIQRECAKCGAIVEENTALKEHTEGEWIVDKVASCVEEGSMHKECIVCGKTLSTEKIPTAGEHIESNWIVDKDATCAEDGKMHIECTVCGSTMAEEMIAATGHTESGWIVDKEATCTEDGERHTECTICGEVVKEKITATGHNEGEWIVDKEATCAEDGKMHTECTVCGEVVKGNLSATGIHEYKNYNCVYCGLTSEECFEFTYLKESDSYAIKAKSKDNLPCEISLPSEFNGKPVTSIDEYAFKNCYNLTSITIPSNVTIISDLAFAYCDSLTSVTIENNVASVGWATFYSCDNIDEVYYKGTAEDWDKIDIKSNNDPLEDATRYYYSETEPTEEGNFWHWGENGEVVVWE